MDELERLKKALEDAIKALKEKEKSLSEAKTDDDKKKAKEEFDAAVEGRKVAQKSLEDEIEKVKLEKKDKALLHTVGTLTTTQVPEGAALAGNDPAEPTDARKKDLEHREIFFKFLSRERLTDNEISAVQPKSEKLLKRIDNPQDACVLPAELWKKMMGQKALPMKSDDDAASGGRSYSHWPEYDTTLQQLPPENPNIYDRVTKKMIDANELKEPVLDQDDDEYGGIAVSRNTEGSTANETEINISQTTFKTYPLDAYTEFTNILLRRDRIGLESEVMVKFGQAFIRRLNWEIVHGTGDTGEMCLGIRQSDDVHTVARQTADAVGWTDLVNLEHEVRVAVRMGAGYAIADTVKKHLKLQTISSDGTTDRRPLFTSTNMISGAVQDRLNDRPWFVGTDLSTIGSNGDVIFGNWLHYWLVLEQEAVISRSAHYKFKNGITAYRVDGLAGGKPLHPKAFAVLVGVGGS